MTLKHEYVWVRTKSLQSCTTLCDSIDYRVPGSSVHGILQARILEWVAIPSSRGNLLNSEIEPTSLLSPVLASGFFTTSATWETQNMNIQQYKWYRLGKLEIVPICITFTT